VSVNNAQINMQGEWRQQNLKFLHATNQPALYHFGRPKFFFLLGNSTYETAGTRTSQASMPVRGNRFASDFILDRAILRILRNKPRRIYDGWIVVRTQARAGLFKSSRFLMNRFPRIALISAFGGFCFLRLCWHKHQNPLRACN